jgi:hypothetical protein
MPAAFQDVQKSLEIGVDIGLRLIDRMPNAGLRRKMDHPGKSVFCEQVGGRRPVCEVDLLEGEARIAAQNAETSALQGGIIVAVDVVQSDDAAPIIEQPTRNMKTDEAGCSRHQDVVGNWLCAQ